MSNDKLAIEIQQKAIQKVFDQRSEFIIIGLTGSRKAHTFKIANIMQQRFEDFNLNSCDNGSDKRLKKEHEIILEYAKVHWKEFDVIKARDVIITYLLENEKTLERFKHDLGEDLIDDSLFEREIKNGIKCLLINFDYNNSSEKLIKEDAEEFLNDIDKYGLKSTLFNKNKQLLDYIDKLKNRSSRKQDVTTLYVYTKYILPIIGERLQKNIDEVKYSQLFQKYGNEIRFFGTIDMDQWRQKLKKIKEISNYDYFYSIAKRINTFIKLRRSPFVNSKSMPVRIVIDSLKNTYESSFLKDRYSAYYTFSILKDNKNISDALESDDAKERLGLFENLELVKKQFRLFVQLVNNKIQESGNVQQYVQEYMQSLQEPNRYLKFMFQRLKKMKKENRTSINWGENLDSIVDLFQDDIGMKNLGISKKELEFFVDILKEPIRTFCLIADLVPFFLQDVQNSTQSGDVFLADISTDHVSENSLTYRIVKYISLIMHPGLVPPTPIERCMQIAYSAKVNSGCISRQVGAVVTDDEYNILSVGWNDPPKSDTPCIFRDLLELQKERNKEIYSDMELDRDARFNKYVKEYDFTNNQKNKDILDGLHPSFCFKSIYNKLENQRDPSMSKAIHAEARAFYNGNNDKVKGGYLFTTSSSCMGCTLIAKEREISKIYYIEEYPDIAQEHVANCGDYNKRPKFEIFEGAIGVAYNKLYTPVIPLKDELQLRGIEQLHR